MDWQWLPTYIPALWHGLLVTLLVLAVSVTVGFGLAVPIALAQLRGTKLSRNLARGFCAYIRGTPLLMQLYLLYYGVGSLFPMIPGIREHFLWLVRLDAIYYVLLAFTLNFAGYTAEIMRGAFLSVNAGELEAAAAVGMSKAQVVARIWFPAAFLKVMPTLAGEVIGQLKSTPLAFTVPIMDLMGVAHRIMQDTLRIYEPLLLVAALYLGLTWGIVRLFSGMEKLLPATASR